MASMMGPEDTGSRVDPAFDHPAWARLVDQLDWYDRRSAAAQRAFTRMKVVEIVVAAAIPVAAGVGGPRLLTAALGAAVVVLESLQHLFQWQTNWVLYRSTAEALKHEKFLFLSGAGPYATGGRQRVLAERLEGLISQEHAKWTQGREQADSDRRPAS
jgi:Protein of unknown function (DUF4231)